jgi:hypothetical protein
MKKNTNADLFFICTDRPGCLLVLEQEFPRKIVHNGIHAKFNIDTISSFCDWYCLSQCNELILSGISSFSGEAMKIKDLDHVLV